MTIDVEIGGRRRAVTIERLSPVRFRVVVDGQPQTIDAVRSGEFGMSILVDPEGRVSREVQVAPGGTRGTVLASLDGRTVPVTIDGRRTRLSSGDTTGDAGGDQAIVAPMPGRVVRVLVGPGDEVAARQGVVVVEAMKMENELRAPRAGRVKEIAVAAGASVEAGRVLVVIG
jgi:biotin carboxyl carrier protein